MRGLLNDGVGFGGFQVVMLGGVECLMLGMLWGGGEGGGGGSLLTLLVSALERCHAQHVKMAKT